MSALQAAVGRLGRHMAERRAQRSDRSPPVARPLRLVEPPTSQRLFRDEPLPQRTWCEDRPVRLPGARTPLWYTGPQLTDEDRAVFHWLLRRRRHHDGSLRFSASGALRALGWGPGESDRRRLRQVLVRLQSAILTHCSADGTCRSQALIVQAHYHPTPGGRSGHWQVWLGPAVRDWFDPDPVTPAVDRQH